MKTTTTYLALVAIASLPLALFQGCYTQFGSTARPDDVTEYVTSDSVNQDEYADARRQFYMDQSYPSSSYMGGYSVYDGWGSGWGGYGGFSPGYYGRSPYGYYDPFYDSFYYGSSLSPWYSRWGMAGWAGYGGWVGYHAAYYPVSGGSAYSGRGAGTTRTIGNRRSTAGSQSFVGGTRTPVSQPTSSTPVSPGFTLPSGARRAATSSTPPVAPRILPPSNTGRRGYDGERTPPVVSSPAPSPTSSGSSRGSERHAPAPSTPAPHPSSTPAPAPSGNRGGDSGGSSRGGNRR